MTNLLRRVTTAAMECRFRCMQVLLGNDVQYKAKVYGYDVQLSLNEHIQRAIGLGVYEPEESKWVLDYLRPGMTFLDVGANVGYFSLLAASCVGPQGRVVAFEPSPYCCGKLEETINRNGIRQIALERTALGDEVCNLTLVVENRELHSPSFLAETGDERCTVPVITLDSYLARSSALQRVDMLKIDVEGFEPNVIRGASKALAGCVVGSILCELNEIWLQRNSSSCEELDAMIRSYGFVPSRTMSYEYHKNILYSR